MDDVKRHLARSRAALAESQSRVTRPRRADLAAAPQPTLDLVEPAGPDAPQHPDDRVPAATDPLVVRLTAENLALRAERDELRAALERLARIVDRALRS